MPEPSLTCPSCGSQDIEIITALPTPDLCRCRRCGMRFVVSGNQDQPQDQSPSTEAADVPPPPRFDRAVAVWRLDARNGLVALSEAQDLRSDVRVVRNDLATVYAVVRQTKVRSAHLIKASRALSASLAATRTSEHLPDCARQSSERQERRA